MKILIGPLMNFTLRFMQGDNIRHNKSMYYVEVGNHEYDNDDIDGASVYYKKAIDLVCNNYYAYSAMAAVCVKKGLYDEVITYCNKAIDIHPNALSFLLLCIAYEIKGDVSLSIDSLQKSFKYVNDNVAGVYNKMSLMYMGLNKYTQAEKYCKEAIKIEQNEYGLYNNLAKIYLAQNKLEESIEAFKKVIELTSDKKYIKYAKKEIEKINIIRKGTATQSIMFV